jgi:hypothetical protein
MAEAGPEVNMEEKIKGLSAAAANFFVAEHDDELHSWATVQDVKKEMRRMFEIVLASFVDVVARKFEPSNN